MSKIIVVDGIKYQQEQDTVVTYSTIQTTNNKECTKQECTDGNCSIGLIILLFVFFYFISNMCSNDYEELP